LIKDLKKSIIASILALISIIVWLVPIIIDTGTKNYLRLSSAHGNYNLYISTLNSLGGPSVNNIFLTMRELLLLFIDGWSLSLVIFGIMSILVFSYLLYKKPGLIKSSQFLFLVVWLVPYFLFFIFFGFLSISRFLLPVFPALAVIFAFSIKESIHFVTKPIMKTVIILILVAPIAFMGYQAVSTAYLLHSNPPPPVRAAEYIFNNYSDNNTFIIGAESYRHFQYYLPQFEVVYKRQPPEELIYLHLNNTTIISELDLGFGSHSVQKFTRDSVIYPHKNRSDLFIYPPNPDVVFGFFDAGWYNEEVWGTDITRWIESDASLFLFSPNNQTVTLRFDAISFNNPKTLEVSLSNHFIDRYTISPDNKTKINRFLYLSKGINELELHVVEGCQRPIDLPDYKNDDKRCFSVAIQNLEISEEKIISENVVL
jgi:hypothetical protein